MTSLTLSLECVPGAEFNNGRLFDAAVNRSHECEGDELTFVAVKLWKIGESFTARGPVFLQALTAFSECKHGGKLFVAFSPPPTTDREYVQPHTRLLHSDGGGNSVLLFVRL